MPACHPSELVFLLRPQVDSAELPISSGLRIQVSGFCTRTPQQLWRWPSAAIVQSAVAVNRPFSTALQRSPCEESQAACLNQTSQSVTPGLTLLVLLCRFALGDA